MDFVEASSKHFRSSWTESWIYTDTRGAVILDSFLLLRAWVYLLESTLQDGAKHSCLCLSVCVCTSVWILSPGITGCLVTAIWEWLQPLLAQKFMKKMGKLSEVLTYFAQLCSTYESFSFFFFSFCSLFYSFTKVWVLSHKMKRHENSQQGIMQCYSYLILTNIIVI